MRATSAVHPDTKVAESSLAGWVSFDSDMRLILIFTGLNFKICKCFNKQKGFNCIRQQNELLLKDPCPYPSKTGSLTLHSC